MRRKHRIDLYNDLPIDREINDVLASAGGRKQEIMRTLLRQGYLALKGQGVSFDSAAMAVQEAAALVAAPQGNETAQPVKPKAPPVQSRSDARSEEESGHKPVETSEDELLDHNPIADQLSGEDVDEGAFEDPLARLARM